MSWRIWVLTVCFAPALCALPGDECKTLRRHGKTNEANKCFADLLRAPDAFSRAEGNWGLEQFEEANQEFRAAEKAAGKPAALKTEWGFLFLDRNQPGDAAKLFGEALAADEKYAPAYLGMARAAAGGYDKRAPEMAREALEQDPKLYQAHELLAYLALEDNDARLAREEANQALALSADALDALAVLSSIDWLDDKTEPEAMRQVLKINPHYGEAYVTGAHFFEINRRYEEAIRYYRKALELNPRLWEARSQLGVNLMRQGNESEARRQLEQCYQAHFRNKETVNSLRLLDQAGDFETSKTAKTELRLHKKEAGVLQPYVQAEMQRSIATYERKYGMKLPGPVQLEMYPNHDDFIVRTLGVPGVGGLLGVTFGQAVAMDSPTARPPGEFNWASTLWHEMSHVFVLTATRHLVPRWFTEGLAVHEETAASPDWGDRLTPEIISALEKKQLLPVQQLDRGFIRPAFPGQVIVSYYQAGQICDFISQKWGDAALVAMIHSYAAKKTTDEAIQADLHESTAEFDKQFRAWLEQRTAYTVQHFGDWKKSMKAMHAALEAGKLDEAVQQGMQARDFYREYVGAESAYETLASVYDRQKHRDLAVAELEKYRDVGGKRVETLKKLAEWEQQAGSAKQAQNTLAKLNYIYPKDEEIHRRLGSLLLNAGDADGAVREGKALIALTPADAAESHFQLARALQAAHRPGEAKDQVLIALEAAPGYKPAQQLLLQLSQ